LNRYLINVKALPKSDPAHIYTFNVWYEITAPSVEAARAGAFQHFRSITRRDGVHYKPHLHAVKILEEGVDIGT